MKKKNELTLQEAMRNMLEEFRLSSHLNEARVVRLWEQLMGKTIATYTGNITVRKNVLYITIISASLKQELSYAVEKIKNMMNQELGEEFIKEVVIR